MYKMERFLCLLTTVFFTLITCKFASGESFEVFTENYKPFISAPVLPFRPFVAVWNIDTGACGSKYGVPIDLTSFDIVHNPDETSDGKNMMIFYSNRLGLYPNFDKNGNPVNGGIPQLGNLTEHLKKCEKDINQFLPDANFKGLSVIDWESWRPLWVHNGWGEGLIYQNASMDKVKREHPDWSETEIKAQAKLEFETASKAFMLETLKLGERMRPNGDWGYYLFPDCYNYAKNGSDYTCHKQVLADNDILEWLFGNSSALYPSTYVGLWFKNSEYTIEYAGNRVKEAIRVDKNRPSNTSVPIYAYNNLVYRLTREFLTKKDVIHSSGAAAILGASGVVLWGDYMQTNKSWCEKLQTYVSGTLGPYLKMASDAASICSINLCHGHGRCVFQKSTYNDKLVFLPEIMTEFLQITLQENQHYQVSCQCYDGFLGKYCKFYH